VFATVTTLKAPVQETLAFVAYHLRSGVDHMYLFFDDPEDEAIPSLQGKKRVTCVRCNAAHWKRLGVEDGASLQERQHANATYAFCQARRADMDWIAHIDSDELLYSSGSLRALFSAVSPQTDVLLFPVMEAVPQRLQYRCPFQEISLFKHFLNMQVDEAAFTMRRYDRLRYWANAQIWRRKKQVATMLGCTHSQIIGDYLLGHMVGKSATRTTAKVRRMGNHLPVTGGEKLRLSVAVEGAVLHYDCQGYEPWKAKWNRRVTGHADFDTSRFAFHRKRQLRQFGVAYNEDCEKALVDLYKKWYFVPAYERTIMQGLNLMRRVDLSPSRFEMP
jgi:hypothetical protein